MLYNYNTPIYARVHSKKLGLLRWTFSGLILAYIVFYSMLYKGGYLKEEAPIGTVRFSVQHAGIHKDTHQPCHDPFEAGCVLPQLHATADLSYCIDNPDSRSHKKFPCRHYDATESTTMFEKSLLVATRITEYVQDRVCPWSTNGKGNTKACTNIWKNHNEEPPLTFFVADVEAMTLVLDHAIDTPTLGVTAAARTSPQGLLLVDNDATCASTPGQHRLTAPCTILPNKTSTADAASTTNQGLDVFTVNTLIHAANDGRGLDDPTTFASNHSLRYTGMVLVMFIEYSNFVPWYGVVDETTYKYRTSFIKGTGAKNMEEEYLNAGHSTRLLQKKHGLLLAVKFTGTIRSFDWSECLMTLTTSLALLAVATTIVDALALYLLDSDTGEFDKIKYQDVRLGAGEEGSGTNVGRGKRRVELERGREGEKEEEQNEEMPLLGGGND